MSKEIPIMKSTFSRYFLSDSSFFSSFFQAFFKVCLFLKAQFWTKQIKESMERSWLFVKRPFHLFFTFGMCRVSLEIYEIVHKTKVKNKWNGLS